MAAAENDDVKSNGLSEFGEPCKPITMNPHFGDVQQEELRNRLILVK